MSRTIYHACHSSENDFRPFRARSRYSTCFAFGDSMAQVASPVSDLKDNMRGHTVVRRAGKHRDVAYLTGDVKDGLTQ
jgi:hypothetical protein